jgi:hypothetical protein
MSGVISQLENEHNLKGLKEFLPKSINVDELLNSLDTNDNDKMFDKTKQSIEQTKQTILEDLGLEEEERITIQQKLKNYMYIDDLSELNYGAYIRWYSLIPDFPKYLRLGGFLTDIDFMPKGVLIRVLTMNKKYISFYFDKNIIFQKLSDSNMLLLELMTYMK